MKKIILVILTLLPINVCAQWRVGITGGGVYNKYTTDDYYLSDLYTDEKWGLTIGAASQYTIKEWNWLNSAFGIRAEINLTNKAYVVLKKNISSPSYIDAINRYYLQIPAMASFSFGSKKIRGVVNLGGYGGFLFDTNEWNRKANFGGVGGIGCEYTFRQLTFQVEGRFYADALSTTKPDRAFNTPHYNTTLALQAALFYNF